MRILVVGRRSLLGWLVVLAMLLALPVTANATLAATPTPYMGWNTYYGVGGVFNEATIKSVASSLSSSGLAQAGYKIVWLDFGWASGARDSNGNLTVDSTQWPDGMKALTDWLHAQGLQAGIYTDAGESGCSFYGPDLGPPMPHTGSEGHYDQDFLQFARWGFDYVKVDWCGGDHENLDPAVQYAAIASAIRRAEKGNERKSRTGADRT